ncbi:MAG: LLM class flavin-dependent oxidoreductase [Rhizorhabdus sp.]
MDNGTATNGYAASPAGFRRLSCLYEALRIRRENPMSIDKARSTNPFFNDQPFKIGLFAYLHQGGMALTKAPERWDGSWDNIETMARMADQAGMDYLIPIANWKGWKGEVVHRRHSFETLTHAAALAGVTKNIGLVATVHAPLVPPIFAAKALTTIDHASRGRAALNIVCGWNKADFDAFGVPRLEHDERYEHGLEWYEIITRILREGGGEDFDYDGKYFRDLKGIAGEPASLQQPHPAIISAAYSPAGRDFAIKTSDILMTGIGSVASAAAEIADIRRREDEAGRTKALTVIGTVWVTCRETREEAERFNQYYAVEQADDIAIDAFVGERSANASAPAADTQRRRFGAAGGGLIVGTPEDLVEQFVELKKAGMDGVALLTLNYVNDLPLITDRVMPLMEKAGLRLPSAVAVPA